VDAPRYESCKRLSETLIWGEGTERHKPSIARLLIAVKSTFILFAASIRSSTSMNRDVSSANIMIGQCFITCALSFKYIKNSNGPRTDPWGTPAMLIWRL